MGVTLAVIACDLGNTTPEEATEIRELVADVLNVPRKNVMFDLSHNHSSPILPNNNRRPLDSESWSISTSYYKELLTKIVDCTGTALSTLREARMACSWGEANLNVYRREWDGEQDILGEVPDHPVDESVGVIRFDDLNGKAIATLFRYSCHPVVNGVVSPILFQQIFLDQQSDSSKRKLAVWFSSFKDAVAISIQKLELVRRRIVLNLFIKRELH